MTKHNSSISPDPNTKQDSQDDGDYEADYALPQCMQQILWDGENTLALKGFRQVESST